jgi:hypothetical protein
MNAFLLSVLVINHDELSLDDVTDLLENQRYPNHCMAPVVVNARSADIGEWTDNHPLNTAGADYTTYFVCPKYTKQEEEKSDDCS